MLSRSRLILGQFSLPITPVLPPHLTANMSTFILPDSKPECLVRLSSDVSKDQLLSFPAFKTWISTLQHNLSMQKSNSHVFHSAPYKLRNVDIQSVDFFGRGRLGFVKLKVDVSNDQGEKLPGSVFLRGGSVGMLVRVLRPHFHVLSLWADHIYS